jgi:hypothetical protein
MRIRGIAAALAAVAAIFSAPTSAQTSYEIGSFTVAFLRITQQQVHVSLSPAPAVCAGGTSWGEHIILNLDAPHSQEMYSALLSAYMSGTKLSVIWFDEFAGPCSNNYAPRITAIRFESK